ncbi:caspase family protein [Streptomyces sp. NPDC055013]
MTQDRTRLGTFDPKHSRIVLIGTPRYRDDRLPDVPVVAYNVADLAAVFTDPELGAFHVAHCVTVPPEADLAETGDVLADAAEQASDLLLVYYSGHGLLDRLGRLYLSLAGTRPDRLAYSALAFEAIRETFLDSSARNRVLILDSCFSGRAIGQPLAGDEQAVLAQLEVSGTFTLTSAPANRVALVLPGEQHTAFTERFLELLRHGSPQAGPMLTLRDVYAHLHARLGGEGLPAPQQRGTGTTDQLGLVRNRQTGAAGGLPAPALSANQLAVLTNAGLAGHPAPAGLTLQKLPGATVLVESHGAVAIEQALRITSDVGSKQARRICLSAIAPVVAAIDLHQALAIAANLPLDRRDTALADIAVVVAGADVFRALELVLNSPEHDRARALGAIAKAGWRRHPDNGMYIVDTYIFGGTPKRRWSPESLSEIAQAVAEFNPDRAEQIAADIPEEHSRTEAMSGIAATVAATDPDRASRITDHLIASRPSGWKLAAVARAVATIDPDRALRLIFPITDTPAYPRALVAIARVIAAADPDRALRIADGTGDRDRRAEALARIAQTVAATDLDQALRVVSTIGDIDHQEAALSDIAPVVAATDPEQAMRMANGIAYTPWKVLTLAGIASVLLDIPQPRSSAISLSVRGTP